MYRIKSLICFIASCIFIMAALLGCATPTVSPPLSSQTNTGIVRPSWLGSSWEIIYSPQIRTGKTIDDAVAEIEKYLVANDTAVAYEARDSSKWYRVQQCSVDSEMISIQAEDKKSIDVNLSLSDLPEYKIYVIQTSGNGGGWNYAICLHGLVSFYFKEPADVLHIADDLFLIQQHVIQRLESRLALFKEKAAQYLALAVKPAMSEEQRKFVVQANALNRLKDYAGAIGLYQKAIDLDPVSYPGAYFNLALINAQMKRYDAAIGYMKQYLMLVPDAKDFRSAQDRIYEWEIIKKKQES